MKTLIFLASLFASRLALADYCRTVDFADPSRVTTSKDGVVIVTHASTYWDGSFSSKAGINSAVAFAKRSHLSVVYLQDDAPESKPTYFYADCKPDYWISSSGGEFSFPIAASHVYTVGGHFEACQLTTMASLLRGVWQPLQQNKDVVLTEVMDALYSDASFVESTDAYFPDVMRFLDVLSYNNPRDPIPLRHLSVLQTMGLIQKPALQVEFLKRSLTWLNGLTTKHKVDLYVNGKFIETVRAGKGSNPPTLKIEFKNSLYDEAGSDIIPN